MKILLIAVYILSSARANDSPNIYCDEILCKGTDHIACSFNYFGDACPRRRELADMTPIKHLIINQMNTYRSYAAKGLISEINAVQAFRKIKMKWDEKLSYVAEFNVKRCYSAYDNCHNTHRFRDSEQSIYTRSISSDGDINKTQTILSAIQHWYRTKEHCTGDVINSYRRPSNQINSYRPFTVLVHENTHVGCAAVETKVLAISTMYVCCNFAHKNIPGKPVFEVGRAANGCINGLDIEHPSLCAEDTSIDAASLAGCGEDQHEHSKNVSNDIKNILISSYTLLTTIFLKLYFDILIFNNF